MRDLKIENRFMEYCIVLHDINNGYPIVVKISTIEAILKDIYDDVEHCVIYLHNSVINASETMEAVLRMLQRKG